MTISDSSKLEDLIKQYFLYVHDLYNGSPVKISQHLGISVRCVTNYKKKYGTGSLKSYGRYTLTSRQRDKFENMDSY